MVAAHCRLFQTELGALLHNLCMITYPRSDGAIYDAVVCNLGIFFVFKFSFGGEDGCEEPVEELVITTTDEDKQHVSMRSKHASTRARTIRTYQGWKLARILNDGG